MGRHPSFNPFMVYSYAELFSCMAVIEGFRINGRFDIKSK